ncbi:hypothetical protein [Vibrio sp. ABG19]|uniref:hypothetical protein n=1 Tax=Vibrio sp. ABG19 TaxID=2817385 RepID=UPI00249DEAD9|nr:hypothetical protein [Vibrio sp. ABG19]WGY45936.1 hypothetical protein J0X00_06150 [Vibrio sp. ABG19]
MKLNCTEWLFTGGNGGTMLLPHPLLAIRHLLHERKPVPDKPPREQSNRRLRQAQK